MTDDYLNAGEPPYPNVPEIPSHARPDLIITIEGGLRLMDRRQSWRTRLRRLLESLRKPPKNRT